MPNQNKDTALGFHDFCSREYFRIAKEEKEKLLRFLAGNRNGLSGFRQAYRKDANEFTEYRNPQPMMVRVYDNDRVFPLETIRLESFKGTHDMDAGEAVIHVGAYADEMARSMNALAITIGTDIYFRHNAYDPGSEEGGKVLAHELTHTAQYNEGRITGVVDEKALEEEAEEAEGKEVYDPDAKVPVEIGRRVYKIRRTQMKKISKEAARDFEKWVVEQKAALPEREYLQLLCGIESWLKRVD
jgi:hypothetical protein